MKLVCLLVVVLAMGSGQAAPPINIFMADIITDDFQPQQIHLAIGETSQDIIVTWTTPSQINATSVVEFGTTGLDQTAEGIAVEFVDGGSEKRSMWIHRATLSGLLPNTRYFYHCGSSHGWSEMFTFLTWMNGTDWPVSLAVFGDLGAVNPQSLPRLQEETQQGMYHAVVHVGDFAYDMDSDNARVGDQFMRQIQPIAGYLPYMTCPGNHEQAYNFSNYRSRFSMPNYEDTESLFYSWNIGHVHLISISTESYYYVNYGFKPLSRQYQWLIDDLEAATKPEARAKRPWIVLYGHRPMYCSNNDKDDCTRVNTLTRVGLPLIHKYGMEDLLDKYGVDLAIWAHEHSYERLWPIYNYTVLNGSTDYPYTNPKGPVHITTGSAGCKERFDPFKPDQPSWSAFRLADYGYSRLHAINTTHLYWEQVSDDQGGEVVDSIWLVRDQHIAYPLLRGDQTSNFIN